MDNEIAKSRLCFANGAQRKEGTLTRSVHPSEVLEDEPDEMGATPQELARQLNVPSNRINRIIAEKRSVTGDTALRIGHWFGTKPQF